MKHQFKWVIYFLSLLVILTVFNNCFAQQNNWSSNEKFNLKTKDSIVQIYYDENTNEINEKDSSRAAYVKVLKYRDGNVYGPVHTYLKNGSIFMTGHYIANNIKKGYENGKIIYYYDNGKFKTIENYENGILEGVHIGFYPTGLPKEYVSFKQGKRNGCEFFWDEKGKLLNKGVFENIKLINQKECDTLAIYKSISFEKKLAFDGWNQNNYSENDWKVVNNYIHYISNTAQINESRETLTIPSLSKDTFEISPLMKIEGFKQIKGQYSLKYEFWTSFEEGKIFENKYSEDVSKIPNSNNTLDYYFIFKKPFQKKGSSPLLLSIILLIKDNFSEAVILVDLQKKYFY